MADLNKLTISEAKAGLRDKKFSSVELTRDCFTEIKKRDKDLNAFVCLTEEEAIKSAENFDKKMQANEKLSDLVEAGKVFEKDDVKQWVCRKCGYVHTGRTPPEECPACSHKEAYYQIKSEEY